MSNLKKPFMTVDEQIDRLKKRGLQIDNREDVYGKLLLNNYYTVVNGYKSPFLVRQNIESSEQSTENIEEQYVEGLHLMSCLHCIRSIVICERYY